MFVIEGENRFRSVAQPAAERGATIASRTRSMPTTRSAKRLSASQDCLQGRRDDPSSALPRRRSRHAVPATAHGGSARFRGHEQVRGSRRQSGDEGPWVHGFMGLWVHGSMGPWGHGAMGLWDHGSLGPSGPRSGCQGPGVNPSRAGPGDHGDAEPTDDSASEW